MTVVLKPSATALTDDELLAARVARPRRIGQWLAAAVAAVLLAMLVHSVLTNPRFQWEVVGQYFTSTAILRGLVLTAKNDPGVRPLKTVGARGVPSTSNSTRPGDSYTCATTRDCVGAERLVGPGVPNNGSCTRTMVVVTVIRRDASAARTSGRILSISALRPG
jgi:hypothetical protein